MKTNQLMSITFNGDVLRAYHKTGEIVLADVWRIGNNLRTSEGLRAAHQTQFLNSETTKRFIAVCEARAGGQPVIRKEGRGKNSKTFVSIHLAIFAAEYLSLEFHWEVIDTLINSKILEHRDASGDRFKALNVLLDTKLTDRVGKQNRNIFIQAAVKLKQVIQPDGDSWNTATAAQLIQRIEIEGELAMLISRGYVTTWPQVKEYFNKL